MNEQQPKLLLVEDDPFMASLMDEAFAKEGFKVILAGDGEAAIQMFEREHPDCAILDIILPKKNGIEALREIRKLPRGEQMPVIVLSNIEDASFVAEAEELGVKGYLVKANVQIPEVVERMKQILGGS